MVPAKRGTPPSIQGSARHAGTAARTAGLVVILVVSLHATPRPLTVADLAVCGGVFSITAFLWLVCSGYFGYGSAGRRDWVALIPFLLALVLREALTRHSVQELEIQFAHGPVGRHSLVYPLLQMFFVPLVRDPHGFTMHMNGILGAAACLGMYLFVRQRTGSRRAGCLSALFLALHPVVARFAPTDGPYSLMLATWFAGLALLSAPEVGARSLLGGAALLGIAATTRIEGVLLLAASWFLLDTRELVMATRRHRLAATLGYLVIYLLCALQMRILLPRYLPDDMSPGAWWLLLPPRLTSWFDDAVWISAYNSVVFALLVWLGVAAGCRTPARLGLRAYVAMIVVLAPVAGSWSAPFVHHRMIPTYAVQALLAGLGAYNLAGWIPAARRRPWLALLPGTLAATYIVTSRAAELTKPYMFTAEYELVRSHLAPGGTPRTDCVLMTFNSHVAGDVDLHDFAQVVPGVQTLDCQRVDCVARLSSGGCIYYVRSAACYLDARGGPAACIGAGVSENGAGRDCLNPACASFERAVELHPIEIQTIDIRNAFNTDWRYPAQVGLFAVRAPP